MKEEMTEENEKTTEVTAQEEKEETEKEKEISTRKRNKSKKGGNILQTKKK